MYRGQARAAQAGGAAPPSGAGQTGSNFQEAQSQHGGQTVADGGWSGLTQLLLLRAPHPTEGRPLALGGIFLPENPEALS